MPKNIEYNQIDETSSGCPLCSGTGPFEAVIGPMKRAYWLCQDCSLIFMDSKFLPGRAAERERYQAHQNGAQDAGYVRFLKQAISPALPYLNNCMRGLDYGCGPTPTLSGLLKSHGLHCENYDPFFCPELPGEAFDFIFSTEVVEHFFNPARELECLSALLLPGGILTIMTEPWKAAEGFAEWHYAKDMTHVSFYHARTIAFICAQYGFEILNHASGRVWVLKKQLAPVSLSCLTHTLNQQ